MTLQQLFTSFEGRINRQTYWTAVGLFIALNILLYIVFFMLLTPILYFLINLALLYPAAAVAVKRLHDMGQQGWLAILFIVPIVSLVMLIWCGVAETKPENEYGAPQSAPLEFKWA